MADIVSLETASDGRSPSRQSLLSEEAEESNEVRGEARTNPSNTATKSPLVAHTGREREPTPSGFSASNSPFPASPVSPAPSVSSVDGAGRALKRLSLDTFRNWARPKRIANSSEAAPSPRSETANTEQTLYVDGAGNEVDDDADECRPIITLGGRTFSKDTENPRARDFTSLSQQQDTVYLTVLASRFASSALLEDSIVDASQSTLRTKIGELELLKRDVEEHVKRVGIREGSFREQKAVDLLQQVSSEIALYEQFLESNGKRVTLESILSTRSEQDDELGFLREANGATTPTSLNPSRTASSDFLQPPTSIEATPSEISFTSVISVNPSSPRVSRHRRTLSQSSLGSGVSHTSSTIPSTVGGVSSSSLSMLTSSIIPPGPNDVFRWTSLPTLSQQLLSDSMKQRIGIPITFAVGSGGIVIGTSRSLVALFDFTQTLKAVLGDPVNGAEYGSVTALSMSTDHKLVACGYSKGVVCVWDLMKGIAVRTILPLRADEKPGPKRDGHTQGTPVIHVAFVGAKGNVVSADNQGSAFYHSIAKVIMISTPASTRIHPSKPRPSIPTTIYALAPLPHIHNHSRYPGDHLNLVALSTPYKMAIISLKPLQTQYKISWVHESKADISATLKASPMSCLQWWPPMKQKDGMQLTVPLLAVSCGKRLMVVRVSWVPTTARSKRESFNKSPAVEYTVRGELLADSNIIAIQWLDERLVACLTSAEELVLYDIKNFTEVERTNLKGKQIVCHDFFSKPLAATMVPVEMAYYQSLRMYRGRLFVMGLREVTIASRLSWIDRLKALVMAGNFTAAIEMGLDFYRGQHRRAVTSLPSDDGTRRHAVGDHLAGLLVTYVDMALSGHDGPPRNEEDTALYKQLAAATFDTCLATDREDLLFGDLYDRFCEKNLQGVFLETLEPLILSDTITALDNPGVIQAFVLHYRRAGWLDRVEQVILHLDPTSLDIHETIGTCREHRLYSALIYVYNRAGDYVTPIAEMLAIVEGHLKREAAIKGGTRSSDAQGKASSSSGRDDLDRIYILYVYLAYVLTGKAFPIGTLSKKEAQSVRSDVCSFLLSPFYASWPPDDQSDIARRKLGAEPYPYVRLLLQYDARDFLKVAAVAMEDSCFGEGVRVRQNVFVGDRNGRARFVDKHEIGRQSIIDAILTVVEGEHPVPVSILGIKPGMLGLAGIDSGDFKHHELVGIYAFIARMFPKFRHTISLPDEVLLRALFVLTFSRDAPTHEERELAVLSLVDSDYDPCKTDVERYKMIDIYREAGFWRVCEVAVRKVGRLDMVLGCYLHDPLRKGQCFAALRGVLEAASTPQQIFDVKQSVFRHISPMVEINGEETAALILDYWPSELRAVGKGLEEGSIWLWRYLEGLLDPPSTRTGVLGGLESPSLPAQNVEKRRTSDLRATQLGEDLYEQYIECACIHDAAGVKSCLERLCDRGGGYPYRFEKVLDACTRHGIVDAAVWILEKSGNLDRALHVLLEKGKEAALVASELESGAEREGEGMDAALEGMASGFEMAMHLCERNSGRLGREEKEALWFQLLDAVMECQKSLSSPSTSAPPSPDALTSTSRLTAAFKHVGRTVMTAMIGNVSLPSILYRIIKSQHRATLGDHREVLFSMLDSYAYENELLSATNRILSSDVHGANVRSERLRRHAFMPARGQCGICRRILHVRAMRETERGERVLVMRCGHAFHAACLLKEVEKRGGRGDDLETAWCLACSKRPPRPPGRSKPPRRDSKGKERATPTTPVSRGLENLAAEEETLQSQLANIDQFVRLSTNTPTSTIFSVLGPEDLQNGDVIELNDEAEVETPLRREGANRYGSSNFELGRRQLAITALASHKVTSTQRRLNAPCTTKHGTWGIES
ncbi:Vacuolar protein sorting-associated protein 8 [Borealophlyctis nickersoniae]|nr:Vacuolar protein sorting-associated protein 8 [Borealophlyctis nickersoniae]